MSYAPLATDSTSPPSPNPSETLARATRLLTRPRCLALALVAMLGFAVGSVTLVPNVAPRSLWSGGHLRKASDGALKQQLSGGGGGLSRPPPGEGSFKDNLLPDVRYLTAWTMSGWNNQVLSAMNLLHLQYLLSLPPYPTPHVAVLPPFFPHLGHLDTERAPVLRVSQVFDLDRFAAAKGYSVVEWSELKTGLWGDDVGGAFITDEWAEGVETGGIGAGPNVTRPTPAQHPPPKEKMNCWSSWMAQYNGDQLQGLGLTQYYNIDTSSLTPLPLSVLSQDNRSPYPVLFSNLVALLSPPSNRGTHDYLEQQTDEPQAAADAWGKGQNASTVWGPNVEGWKAPDSGEGEMVCLDYLYFASERGEEIRELYSGQGFDADYGPWPTVGRHLRWSAEVDRMTDATLRSLMGLSSNAPIPPIITVHIRRTDFLEGCPDYAKPCFSLPGYIKHVAALRARLVTLGRKGVQDYKVVVATDDDSAELAAEISHEGWLKVDHGLLRTRETYGVWAPTIVDSALLSRGQGFVGTDGSTMSILAYRRTIDWNEGVGSYVGLLESFLEAS